MNQIQSIPSASGNSGIAMISPHAFHEHVEHRRFFGEHFVRKGREATRACREVLGQPSRAATMP